jgi:c-di-GMP-binding flagellar brake protein YcgR
MSDAYLERRRELRVPMKDDERIGVPMGLTVRLMDISAGGVLLFSPQELRLGQKARLRTTLGADPFQVDIEVRRIADAGVAGAPRGGYRVGAVFTGVDEAAKRSVRHFLSGEFQ